MRSFLGRKPDETTVSGDKTNDRHLDLRDELPTFLFRITGLNLPHKLFDVLVHSRPLAFGWPESTSVQVRKPSAALTRRIYDTRKRLHKPEPFVVRPQGRSHLIIRAFSAWNSDGWGMSSSFRRSVSSYQSLTTGMRSASFLAGGQKPNPPGPSADSASLESVPLLEYASSSAASSEVYLRI